MNYTHEIQGTIRSITSEGTVEICGSPNQCKQFVVEAVDEWDKKYDVHINAWNNKIYKLDRYQIGYTIAVRIWVKSFKHNKVWKTLVNLIDVVPTDFEEYLRIESTLEKVSNDPLDSLNTMKPLTPEELLGLQLKTFVDSITEYTELLIKESDESRDKWQVPSARMRRAFVKFIKDCNIPNEAKKKLLSKVDF